MRFKKSQINLSKGTALTVFLMLQIGLTGCEGKVNPAPNQVVQQAEVLRLHDSKVLTQPPTALIEQPASPVISSATFLAPQKLVKKLRNPVNDFTQTLTVSEVAALNKKIAETDAEGLLQVGVVIVPTTGELSTFDYAMTLAQGWQLGSPENNNGLLILVAKQDRKMYILTGLDVQKLLPDERVKDIIDTDITPHFPQGDYARGLMAGIDALSQQLRDSAKTSVNE